MIAKVVRSSLKLLLSVSLVLALANSCAAAQEHGALREFKDDTYGFRFVHPAEWKVEPLPDGEKNPLMRVRMQGPAGSSFVVIVEKLGEPLSRSEFQADPKSDKKVETMMRQTLEQTYHSISKNLGALSMKTGERLNLSDEHAVKFYLATLNSMKGGNPVVAAGTHVYPFNKDYSVNFTMTAFHRGNSAETQVLTAVFNSFRVEAQPLAPPK
jgi:hypothetical protein